MYIVLSWRKAFIYIASQVFWKFPAMKMQIKNRKYRTRATNFVKNRISFAVWVAHSVSLLGAADAGKKLKFILTMTVKDTFNMAIDIC